MNESTFEERRKKLMDLVKEAGYPSMRAFSVDMGLNPSSIYFNLHQTDKMSLPRMFRLAKGLNVPILQLLEIFYPDEMAENQSLF